MEDPCPVEPLPDPNIQLLKDYSEELVSKVIPCERAPYTVRFKRGDKELTFIAAVHAPGPEAGNRTFQRIKRAFERDKPQIAIVESYHNAEGFSPKWRTEQVRSCEKSNFTDCIEIQFTASLALKSGVPYIGGEPSDKEIVEFLRPSFSANDYACFIWLTAIVGNGAKLFSPENPGYKGERAKYAEMVKAAAGVSFSYDDFLKCYEAKIGKKPDLASLSPRDFQPSDAKGATFFQKIMHRMDKSRNPKILQTIHDSLEKKDRVLIVYGSGHLVSSLDVFREMLGPPSFECEN